jgi:hypothetical protein
MIDDQRFEALRDRLGDVDPGDLRRPKDLALIPVLRKSDLSRMQASEPPFGGLAAVPTGAFARLFASPGGLYEPESTGRDPLGGGARLRRRWSRRWRYRGELLLLSSDAWQTDSRDNLSGGGTLSYTFAGDSPRIPSPSPTTARTATSSSAFPAKRA